jgi:hypothetical protein
MFVLSKGVRNMRFHLLDELSTRALLLALVDELHEHTLVLKFVSGNE